MSISRRQFVVGTAVGAALGRVRLAEASAPPVLSELHPSEPWLEIEGAALTQNVRAIARLTGGKPILAVAKNNAYGCGCSVVGPVLDGLPEVWGIAVVRIDEALALRSAGVKKPVLLMARVEPNELDELIAHDVRITPDEALASEVALRAARGRGVGVHVYVDAGMHRMGVPIARAPALIDALGKAPNVQIEGVFTELTEDVDFDKEMAKQLRTLADAAQLGGVKVGRLHAASSHAVWHIPETFLDAVRPGLAVYGGYVSEEARSRGELRAAYRLRAPVVRLVRLEAGEGVSYHRRWKASTPTWVATLPVGHVDGYPSGAVKGCDVLIGDRVYPVIGTVSASHTLIALGTETSVKVGDVATLVGPDHPAIHPNEVAARAGWSEYNMFMHLNPLLARHVV
ncbi:MAG TPA: alanine racemase [Gemmatimonadaceae bacterium]|nr:alanine racemase [Gemmatimonadaceae bacterium]